MYPILVASIWAHCVHICITIETRWHAPTGNILSLFLRPKCHESWWSKRKVWYIKARAQTDTNVWITNEPHLETGVGLWLGLSTLFFFLSPIILLSNSQNNPLLLLYYSFLSETFSYKNNYVHIVYNYWSPRLLYWTISVAATKSCRELCCCSPNAFLSKENTRSAAAEEGCTKNSFLLSQACLHVAVSLNFEPWLGKFNPIILELFFFYKRTYYSQRNSWILCGGLVVVCKSYWIPACNTDNFIKPNSGDAVCPGCRLSTCHLWSLQALITKLTWQHYKLTNSYLEDNMY